MTTTAVPAAVDVAADVARSSAEARVRGCARPIRLRGSTTRFDEATGEVIDSYSSAEELDGYCYVRCGDRRAWLCESCSREYKGDAWHLLTAGLSGGKGTPEAVGQVPALFVTLTAPSFGPVHGIRQRGPCRGRRDKPVCAHGRPMWCARHHRPDDPRLGEPLCPECYDYVGHVVWQWWAPELWRRTRICLDRYLADALGVPRTVARDRFKVAYSKVAEFQARGVVHFHVVARLDGPDGPGSAPPPGATAEALAGAVADAVRATVLERQAGAERLRLRWGAQLDIRPVTSTAGRDATTGDAHPEQVASYLAKYLTKSTEDFGICHRVRTLGDARRLRPHVRAIIRTAHDLAALDGYEALAERYSTLGYRGHPITKTRRYSTTFGALRRARHQWRQRPPGLDPDATVRDLPADDDPGTEVVEVRDWTYAGAGYLDLPSAIEAVNAAARARERPAGVSHT